MGTVGLCDGVRLVEDAERVGAAALGSRDVGQPDHVGGHARQSPNLLPQPRRRLQQFARLVEAAGHVCRDAQVPQRFGLGQLVADLRGQLARLFQFRNGGLVVTPDDLVETADPEQGLGLAASVTQRPVRLGRAFKQRQLSRILDR